MRSLLLSLGLISSWALAAEAPAPGAAQSVTITVDTARVTGNLAPVWRFFGADEPNYATMKDGRKLLTALGKLRSGEVYFRTHNLLNSGDGTPAFKWGSTDIYTETEDRQPVYDWRVVDRIIDTYLKRGVRPYLQLGFMPEALSSAPAGTPYQHPWRPGFEYPLIATGWSYPPNSYDKWGELVYQWTMHNIARYGREEVERWYFEVWNEPNLDFYWRGSPEEFYRMHDVAIAAVRRALPTARVGGPLRQRPKLAFHCLLIRCVRAHLNQLQLPSRPTREEIHLVSFRGAHVSHFHSPPLEFQQHRRFQSMSGIRAAHQVKHRDQTRIDRISLAGIDHPLPFGSGFQPDGAHQKTIL